MITDPGYDESIVVGKKREPPGRDHAPEAFAANRRTIRSSNCRDQIMKRIPKYYPDYKYEVKYIWQLIAETLVLEPWEEEMVEKANVLANAQWDKLEVVLSAEDY